MSMSWLRGLPNFQNRPNESTEDSDNASQVGEEEEVAQNNPPATNMAPPVNYDAHHADDEADNAMDKAVNAIKNFKWMEDELPFYFAQIEIKMKQAGVKSNFTKLQVLSTILPEKAIREIKALLTKQESDFTNKDAYLQAKTEIL